MRRLVLVDMYGNGQLLPVPPLSYLAARFAPDGRHVAVSTSDSRVHLYELEQGRLTELIALFEDATGRRWTPRPAFAWSPDGARIAFMASSPGESNGEFFVMSVDRSEDVRHVFSLEGGHNGIVSDWSRDGKRILYVRQEGNVDYDIADLPVDSEGPSNLLLQTLARDVARPFRPTAAGSSTARIYRDATKCT